MNQKLQQLLDSIQQSTHLSEDEKNALAKNVKDADKELEITTFKLDRTEKVKRTTAILLEETIEELEQKRKAVEAQNHELEIEASLERVRAIALSMKESADMLEVCSIISTELDKLGVKEIRNVQTAIFYEDEATYMNYEYYAKHNKPIITETSYTNHKMHRAFAEQMLKGKGEFFTTHISKPELPEWIAYQKTTNVFIDNYLETASSLSYYWYSLGPIALGISTYVPLTDDDINLFKRFRNVFELAYRRFLDIELAIKQAKEARIETALERVRAVAMAMKKSEEVINVCEVMYKELNALGFENIRNAQIALKNDDKQSYQISVYSDTEVLVMQEAPYNSSPIVKELYNELGKSSDAFMQKEFKGKKFNDWRKWREGLSVLSDQREKEATSMCFYLYSIGAGHLGISTFNPISAEQVEVLKRFKNVFKLSYTRYIDVAQAEAQTREAEIQLAMERVRARTMAMQKSHELADTAAILFSQFKNLGYNPDRITIGIMQEEKQILELWGTSGEAGEPRQSYQLTFNEPHVLAKCVKAWKEQKKSLVLDLYGQPLKEYTEFWKSFGATQDARSTVDQVVFNFAFFSKGYLGFISFEHVPPQTIELLERFAGVFDLTYTRFLDLEKAEAQSRESQIELGLERVRARAMAMQKSGELSELVDTVFKELTKLDFALTWCIINIIDESSLSNTVWAANPDINKMPESYHMLFEDYPFHHAMMKGWKERKIKDVYILEGQEKKIYDEYLFNETEFRRVPATAQAASRAMEKYVVTFSFSNFGGLQTVGDAPLSDGNLDILSRFGKVFDLTYTRFNDLKQAEAQSKEAQIQLALERVRARTMAMQKSDELSEAVYVLFQQFKELGENPDQATIGIINENEKVIEYWVTMYGSQINKVFKFSLDEPNVTNKIYKAWKENKKSLIIDLSGDALTEFMTYRAGKGGAAIKPDEKRRIINVAFFSKGLLNVQSNEERSEESIKLLERFASVFEQTYTRFLDLKNAEAQARESQIQLALERVRARTMAMQKSEELQDVVHTLLERLKDLNVEFYTAIIILFSQDSRDIVWWLENKQEQRYSKILVPYADIAYLRDLFDARENGSNHFSKTYSFEKKNELFHHLFSDTDFRYVPETQRKFLLESKAATMSVAIEKNTGIHLTRYTDKTFSEEDNAILKRFVNVFEQTYTRFLDLQKAEAQAREAQIEAALERVRSRSMGMQKSDELKEVIQIVYEQFIQLNIHIEHTGFILDYKTRDDLHIWLADLHLVPSEVTIPYFDSPPNNSIKEAKENGKDFFKYLLTFEEKNKFYRDLFKFVPDVPEETLEYYFSCPALAGSGVLLDNIGLYIENFSGVPYTDEDNNTLMRFGKVFQQTYTRFLDLQKAEGQAREGQIELGLERVRAKAMAMQKSDELKELIGTVFTELTKLDLVLTRCVIMIYDTKTLGITWWMANSEDPSNPAGLFVKYHKLPPHLAYIKAWKERDLKWQYVLEKKIKKEWDDFLFSETELSQLPDFVIAGMKAPERVYLNASFNSFGNLTLATLEPLSNEHADILLRFAKVFDLTYTRFNDLKQAETQAHEAKIEAALERVRARTMAMYKSENLNTVAEVVFNELEKLELGILRCGIGIINKEKRSADAWITSVTDEGKTVQVSGTESMDLHPLLQGVYNAWLTNSDFSYILEGEDLVQYYKTSGTGKVRLPDSQLILSADEITTQYYHIAVFEAGGLFAFSANDFPQEAKMVMKRFAAVFNQSYTRFLDLQKAEAQARQAQIEAAMEKVRSRAMAMQKPNELVEVAELLRKEMGLLGVEELETSSIYIHHEDTKKTECWYAIKDVQRPEKTLVSDHMDIDLNETWVGKQMLQFYQSGKKQTSIAMRGDARKEWINYCAAHSKVLVGFYGDSVPDRTYHLYKFSNGYMGAASLGDISDESWDLLQRATSVFSLAYTRFNDLQLAEAQTKEAQIETALERVRSRTLAMQKSDELSETAAVLFKQLILLGIEPNRLYISIMKDNKGETEFWITDEDGSKVSMAYQDNLNNNPSFKKMYDGWNQQKKSLVIDMKGKELQQYFKHLSSIHVPFKGGLAQKRRIQYIAYFSKGFIGMASPDEQPKETIDLLERFAYVFNLTFTRFNDLQIAEAHAVQAEEDLMKLQTEKRRAEDALTELKETQKQLIQSEKMASLGELTAGIAHEIQNPLNFVNNFSEVSKELLDEMKAALESGDKDEAEEIANDIIQNLEKINHHGKRADAIVKGMLQHSRSSSSQKEPTDINALCDEYIRLCFHGLRAKDKSFNAQIKTDFDNTLERIDIIPQDIGRVILNVLTNAFYAVNEKKQLDIDGYEPTVSVSTKKSVNRVSITVSDNGNGIPQNVVNKIFQPFFTTKPTGQGTGLGLSLSYDIIKAHGGEIKVETKESEETVFTITLPL